MLWVVGLEQALHVELTGVADTLGIQFGTSNFAVGQGLGLKVVPGKRGMAISVGKA